MLGSVSRRAAKEWRRLLESMERAVGWSADPTAFAAHAPEVSAWSVGRHLEHLLLSDRRIVGWLEGVGGGGGSGKRDRDADPGRRGPTLAGRLVLLTGFIPRGRGQAPDFTMPADMSRDALENGFRAMRARVASLEPRLDALAASRATLPHPSLGLFTAPRWLRFAAVHHAHHEKIIRSILGASGGR